MDDNSFVFHVRTYCFPKVGQQNGWLTEKKGKKFDVAKMDKRNVNSENLKTSMFPCKCT